MVVTLGKTELATNCLTLPGITWEKLEQIEVTFEGIEGVRFIYLDGELEIIMSPSRCHEEAKSTIGLLLEAYMRLKKIALWESG
ncbi:MAG: hypothetical protein ACK5CA_02900 [Cyanobacteriota bacterium]|jgi:Uma2 family endonuclease